MMPPDERQSLRLVPVEEGDIADSAIHEMLQELDECENGFANPAKGLSFKEYGDFIRGRIAYRHGLGLPEGRVPETWFWLRDGDGTGRDGGRGGRVIGFSKLRHRLNELLRTRGGHIGYGIRTSLRGRGYGTEILRLTLDEARRHGLKEVILTCDARNAVSRRVIEKNGGRLLDEIDERLIFMIAL